MIKIFLLLSLISSAISCISLKIELPRDPLLMLGYMSVLIEVDQEADFSKIIPDQEISTSCDKAILLIKVFSIEKQRKIVWKWFDPKGKLVKKSEGVLVNKENKYLEYFIAWNSIENREFQLKTGDWQVVISIDDQFFAKKMFKIKADSK